MYMLTTNIAMYIDFIPPKTIHIQNEPIFFCHVHPWQLRRSVVSGPIIEKYNGFTIILTYIRPCFPLAISDLRVVPKSIALFVGLCVCLGAEKTSKKFGIS